MFQSFDKPPTEGSSARADWMALLARAPLALLEQGLQAPLTQRRTEWLRPPETGLYMVQGRAGATGQRFNLGELTVTRCTLRALNEQGAQQGLQGERQAGLPAATVGVAYVLGRSHRHAELAAWADALLQEAGPGAELEQTLLAPVRAHLAQQQAQRRVQAQASKVDFFTLAREAGSSDGAEDEQ
ncbi:MAG: phosphonate C-P lyase system protein PhnG [Serpentinimonas sp.]|nr:phosphonate C-P lyase system protein PhnG [Serpentinimonas sp.]